MNDKYSSQWAHPYAQLRETKRPIEISPCVCAWSDLLGFGAEFSSNNWSPTPQQWEKITNRLTTAYLAHCDHHLTNEYILILNDGIIRTLTPPASNPLSDLSLWLREVIISHRLVKEKERRIGQPGARTVLSAGNRALYTFEEVRLDDKVLNYSRPEAGLSELAQITGNPLLIYNPSPLQMNTAFSKAYILDTLGSKAGLGGANIYIDVSLFDYAEALAKASGINAIKEEREDGWLFYIPYAKPRGDYVWYFGALCEKPSIQVQHPRITTEVYRLLALYPFDEDPEKFRFDLA